MVADRENIEQRLPANPLRRGALSNWILYATLAAVFSETVRIQYGVYIRLDYFLMVFNIVLLIVNGYSRISVWVLVYSVYLVASGLVGILFGTDTSSLFAKELFGIVVSAAYYDMFYRYQPISASDIFRMYVTTAYLISIAALVMFFLKLFTVGYDRLYSPMQEPAHYAAAILPALYYTAHRLLRYGDHKLEFVLFFSTLLLSASSTGYIGVLLGVFLLMTQKKKLMIAAPIVIASAFSLFYILSSAFAERLHNAALILVAGDVSAVPDLNLSVYVLMKNLVVSWNGFLAHPIIGNGLGSFYAVHQHYVWMVGTPSYLSSFEELNAMDANSMLLRVLAELGIVGIALCAWFLWKFYIKGPSDVAEISRALLLFFLLQLFREGTYFLPPVYFFAVGYVALWREWKASGASDSIRRMAAVGTGAKMRLSVGELRVVR